MPSVRQPRSGSMQYWPRKRAKKAYARLRSAPSTKDKGLVAFAGYKVGMTHLVAIETRKTSHLKGEEMSIPVTMIECPPVRLFSVKFYKKTLGGMKTVKEVLLETKSKELARKVKSSKKAKTLEGIKADDYDDIKVLVYTQPKLTTIGKKRPEIFEMALGGNNAEKLAYVAENAGKDILLESVFKEGDLTDLKMITTGKGFQGPVKRFGISLRQSKSEKAIRNPGSLGPWQGQGHVMYRVAHAGKMGYHQRTELNKQILKIVSDPKELTPKGGFLNYGNVKNHVLLIKGSVAGPKKRMIILQKASRPKKQIELPTVQGINKSEKQGK